MDWNKLFDLWIKKNYNPILFLQKNGNYYDQIILRFISYYFCISKTNKPCNICEVCIRLITNSESDIYFFDNYFELVKKQDLLDVFKKLNESNITINNKKIVVIFEVEKLNKYCINSLLKNLENPNSNTFYLLTTKNPHLVYETIKSRCFLFSPKKHILWNETTLENKFGILEEYQYWLKAFDSLYEIQKYIEHGFLDTFKFVQEWNNNKNNLAYIGKYLNQFKKTNSVFLTKILQYFAYKNPLATFELKRLDSIKNITFNPSLVFEQISQIINNEQ